MDPSLGRFLSPDTIVPTSTQGTQAWDRYGFVNNNPVRYTDPTGHEALGDGQQSRGCTNSEYCENGKQKNYCMDPQATNFRAGGSCTYPKPERFQKDDVITSIETAISYLQYSPIGLMLYNMMMEQGFTIAYGAPSSGSRLSEKNKIIYVSPDYSPTYIAGSIAHEAMHYQVTESDMLPRLEEYRALLVGDAVRAQIVSAGYGTYSVLRNPLSSYTLDMNIADPVELQIVLDAWFLANEDY